MPSKIEWTDEVWNPTTGCTRVSEGCRNCYAERFANRFRDQPKAHKLSGLTDKKGRWNGRIKFHEDRLDQPIRWKRPRMIFVDSMSDLFHPDVPFDFIDRVMATIHTTERHTYQLLTKRPERMAEYFLNRWPTSNLWLGTSIEDHNTACERVPHLLNCPAKTRFLSCEPLLSHLSLRTGIYEMLDAIPAGTTLEGIHWVIVGGESGPAARPMHPNWARWLRDQCQSAGVAFFFKQWGEWSPDKPEYFCKLTKRKWSHKTITFRPDCTEYDPKKPDELREDDMVTMYRVGKRKSGALLDGVEWKEFPQIGATA